MEVEQPIEVGETIVEVEEVDKDYSADPAKLKAIEPSLNSGQGSTLAVTSGAVGNGSDGYTVTVTSKTGNTFSIAKAAGTAVVTRTCGPAANKGKNGCPTSGSW